MGAAFRLRQERLAQLCTAAKIDNSTELARAMGMSLPGVIRVLSGEHGPGAAFIASLWDVFPDVPLEELLERVPQ